MEWSNIHGVLSNIPLSGSQLILFIYLFVRRQGLVLLPRVASNSQFYCLSLLVVTCANTPIIYLILVLSVYASSCTQTVCMNIKDSCLQTERQASPCISLWSPSGEVGRGVGCAQLGRGFIHRDDISSLTLIALGKRKQFLWISGYTFM
jgi:hypothetical protein